MSRALGTRDGVRRSCGYSSSASSQTELIRHGRCRGPRSPPALSPGHLACLRLRGAPPEGRIPGVHSLGRQTRSKPHRRAPESDSSPATAGISAPSGPRALLCRAETRTLSWLCESPGPHGRGCSQRSQRPSSDTRQGNHRSETDHPPGALGRVTSRYSQKRRAKGLEVGAKTPSFYKRVLGLAAQVESNSLQPRGL